MAIIMCVPYNSAFTSNWWLTSGCYQERSAKRIILSKPYWSGKLQISLLLRSKIVHDRSLFFHPSNLPYVSSLVLICPFPLKSQNETKWMHPKLPSKSKTSTWFLFQTRIRWHRRSYKCYQKALLKEKSGNPSGYVSRRPLKLMLCIALRESVGFTGEYLFLNKDHIRTSLLQK